MVHRLGKREQETSAADRSANLSVLRGGVNSDTASRSAPSTAEFAGKMPLLVDARRRPRPSQACGAANRAPTTPGGAFDFGHGSRVPRNTEISGLGQSDVQPPCPPRNPTYGWRRGLHCVASSGTRAGEECQHQGDADQAQGKERRNRGRVHLQWYNSH
jgi:hypothetical protein